MNIVCMNVCSSLVFSYFEYVCQMTHFFHKAFVHKAFFPEIISHTLLLKTCKSIRNWITLKNNCLKHRKILINLVTYFFVAQSVRYKCFSCAVHYIVFDDTKDTIEIHATTYSYQ